MRTLLPKAITELDVELRGDPEGLERLADVVSIKLPQCDGLYSALQLATAARHRRLDVMLSLLVLSPLGNAAVHLAVLARWCDPHGHLLLAHDPREDGVPRLSGASGLGVQRHVRVEVRR